MNKYINIRFLIGAISYAFLLILAYVYYKERTLWGDIPYHVFHILKDDNFAIQNNRFGAVLTQWIPLVLGREYCSKDVFFITPFFVHITIK